MVGYFFILHAVISLCKLEDTARYAGLLLAPAEGFSLWPKLYLPFAQKIPYYAVLPHFWRFWCPVVILVYFSGNLSNFERNPKKPKKNPKNPKKTYKFQKIQKFKKV